MKLTRRRKCSDFTNPKPTCYTKDDLLAFSSDWNSEHPENKIKNAKSLTKQNLWIELRKRHKTIHEDLWPKKTRKTKKTSKSFAPKVPSQWNKNPNSWLSDADILRAMRRYEKKFPKFHFLEPAPIDFDTKDHHGRCAYSNLCNYSYSDLAKKYNSFAAIFNTDPHDKSGQHWIAFFVNLKKGEISYFDSVADPPPKEVKNLINRFAKEGQAYLKNKTIKVNYNKTRHQLGNTECGVYCLAFVHHMLINGNFDSFTQERIPDEKIVKLRAYFFDDVTGVYDSI
tara:strand:+ start:979 stop:1827 length:849 start_codon:yes stop_codon:yes gene_type:complete